MKIEAEVCERLLRDKVIREEEKEIIQYGLHQGGVLFVNICTLMIVCTTMGCVIQGFWFLVYFWPLRIYAGGYHADTEKRCYFVSTLMEIVIFLIAHFFDFTRGMGVILITFTLNILEVDSIQTLIDNENVKTALFRANRANGENCKNCPVNIFCFSCPGDPYRFSSEEKFLEYCKVSKKLLMERVWGV